MKKWVVKLLSFKKKLSKEEYLSNIVSINYNRYIFFTR